MLFFWKLYIALYFVFYWPCHLYTVCLLVLVDMRGIAIYSSQPCPKWKKRNVECSAYFLIRYVEGICGQRSPLLWGRSKQQKDWSVVRERARQSMDTSGSRRNKANQSHRNTRLTIGIIGIFRDVSLSWRQTLRDSIRFCVYITSQCITISEIILEYRWTIKRGHFLSLRTSALQRVNLVFYFLPSNA